MQRQVNYYWQELNRKYSSNQVFFILAYWTLTIYTLIWKDENGPFRLKDWRGCLLSACKDIMNYDVKEAAVQLSDRIEWSLLEKDEAAEKLLRSYEAEVRLFLYAGEKAENNSLYDMQERLQKIMYELFDLTAINMSYQTTPWSINNMIGNLVSSKDIGSGEDICCGSGMFLFAVWKHLRCREDIFYCGMDIEPAICDISCIMANICGIQNGKIVCEDFLQSQPLKKYDLILMDVPRGQNKKVSVLEQGEWIKTIGQKNIFVDWIYLLKVLESMDEKGKGIVVVTSGSLTRKNESMIRKRIVENDWIEAIITLPPNLYPNTRTGSEIIIFNKNKEKKRRNKILFVDISQYYYRDGRNYYSISQEGMKLLLDTYEGYSQISQISCIISNEEIDKDIWSLKPLRYIENQIEKHNKSCLLLKEIAKITRGVQLKREEEAALSQHGTALLLNIKDIQDGKIHYEYANRITPKSYDWHNKFQIQENDIIITSKGTNFKIAIVENNPPEAYISGNLTIIRVDQSKYHPDVLLEYLISAKGMRALESIQSGTTIRMINNANLEKLKIPVYQWTTMNLVGEHLRNKRRKYKQQIKQLTDRYEAERKVLLEKIKIDE